MRIISKFRDYCVGEGMMAFADWRFKEAMWDWHALVRDGWPGWERGIPSDEPWRVDLNVKHGTDKSSRDWAIEIDDVATGPFYYRDYTEDTLPVVCVGETYRASFWFARKADRDEMLRRIGGRNEEPKP